MLWTQRSLVQQMCLSLWAAFKLCFLALLDMSHHKNPYILLMKKPPTCFWRPAVNQRGYGWCAVWTGSSHVTCPCCPAIFPPVSLSEWALLSEKSRYHDSEHHRDNCDGDSTTTSAVLQRNGRPPSAVSAVTQTQISFHCDENIWTEMPRNTNRISLYCPLLMRAVPFE